MHVEKKQVVITFFDYLQAEKLLHHEFQSSELSKAELTEVNCSQLPKQSPSSSYHPRILHGVLGRASHSPHRVLSRMYENTTQLTTLNLSRQTPTILTDATGGAVIALDGLISIFGTLGNLLVLAVIFVALRFSTVSNILIANLACVDLLTVTVLIPEFTHESTWKDVSKRNRCEYIKSHVPKTIFDDCYTSYHIGWARFDYWNSEKSVCINGDICLHSGSTK
ncbi:hypothetical protein pdam_00014989 [Pocillopora damicornis]|uniref:G-protein coupled receptors family 1 profile domain-containing protein n=1 Tax=Pocillopora damicornis TaxID=46731 RepID=A0A3M6T5N3_POCDA|nr:hypothetical protein pdam_00014989 [Pocillopora damicornis]